MGLELIEVLKGKKFHYAATANRFNTTYELRKQKGNIHYKANTCTK